MRGELRPRKIAVIVNDMGAINFDADEIKNSKLIQEEAEMVELHNGCVCCTLRGDLLKSVKRLSEEGNYDYLVIETITSLSRQQTQPLCSFPPASLSHFLSLRLSP